MNVTKNIENKGTNKKNLCGLVLIDKAAEINSHKIVSAMRKILNIM